MEIYGIRQFSRITGTCRNPKDTEHDKALVWDDNLKFFVYKPFVTVENNTKIAKGIVLKGDDAVSGNMVWKLDANKNPFWRKEDFLVSATKVGNSAVFTMNDSEAKILPLGALAWVDSIESTIALPGNKKILFDDNDSIGGDSSLTFDKSTKTIDWEGFVGIRAKNGVDASSKGVLQYLGGRNILIAHGITKTIASAANMHDNIRIGEQAGSPLDSGSDNVIVGSYAGAGVSSNSSRLVLIGKFAGRLENGSDKLYVGNKDYNSLAEFREGSLLYGDFSTGHLRVNNRLEVAEEVRIGAFDVANTPLWGMNQFVDDGTHVTYKPQYYNGAAWVDYANGLNYYLQGVTKATADVGTTSAAYRITFDMNGIPDLTLQLGANAFNSLPIPQASIDGTAGFLQISSGDNSDANRGFSHTSKLKWTEASKQLLVDGFIALGATNLLSGAAGNIKFAGNHFWGFAHNDAGTDYEWRRLDVDPSGIGESNDGDNVGLAGEGVYYGKSGVTLQFKNINNSDTRIVLEDNIPLKTIDIGLDLTLGGSNVNPVTVKTYSGSVFGSISGANSSNPSVIFKKLISNTVQIVENGNEVILEVTGIGGGESNTAENVGTGVGLYKDKSGASLRFKSISASGNHVSVSGNPDWLHVDIDVDDIALSDVGVGKRVLVQGLDTFSFTQKALKEGLAMELIETADDIEFKVTKAIPRISATPTPAWTAGLVAGQGALNFKSDFSEDIRSSGTLTGTTFHTLKIGDGLYYDATTNTLKSISGSGATEDYQLTEVSQAGSVLTFHITDELGSGVEKTFDFDMEFPEYTTPLATYTNNVSPHTGVVIVNPSSIETPLATYNQLTLNEATGELENTTFPVLFTPQFELHDDDVTNDAGTNAQRAVARDNIGAAYVNGSLLEDFDVSTLVANKISVCDVNSATENDANVSRIQSVKFYGEKITSTADQASVALSKRASAYDAGSSVVVTNNGIVNINLDSVAGVGEVVIYAGGIKIFRLDKTGKLFLKDGFETFSTHL